MGKDMETNAIYCGDCKDVLQNFPKKGETYSEVIERLIKHYNEKMLLLAEKQ